MLSSDVTDFVRSSNHFVNAPALVQYILYCISTKERRNIKSLIVSINMDTQLSSRDRDLSV